MSSWSRLVGSCGLLLLAGCAGATTPQSGTPPQDTAPASPVISCLDGVPATDCVRVAAAALGAVTSFGKTPVHVWVNTGFLCPRADCVFDPTQNFPYPQPPSGGTWVASAEIAFAGTNQHAGLHVAKVGSSYVPVLIGYRVPLPGWCSGSCASPTPSRRSSVSWVRPDHVLTAALVAPPSASLTDRASHRERWQQRCRACRAPSRALNGRRPAQKAPPYGAPANTITWLPVAVSTWYA